MAATIFSGPRDASALGEAATTPLVQALTAVSWPAIVAGAVVAASTSLILVALGSGAGLAAVSPWAGHGVTASTITVTGVIWLIVTQWVSACVGGYIAGRLRSRWIGTHMHEVFFRDTAHGLITWSVATILIAGVLTSSFFAAAGSGADAASALTSAETMAGAPSAAEAYALDRLLRAPDPVSRAQEAASGASPVTQSGMGQAGTDSRPEIAAILANAAVQGRMPDADHAYLAQLVALRAGVSTAESTRRVDELTTAMADSRVKAQGVADAARHAAAELSIYLALSLLVGAFIASVSAALGGRLRDEHP